MTISLRLDEQLARRLEAAAKSRGLSKSDLIRRCLDEYLGKRDQQPTAWELGQHLFGRDGSGRGDLSERCEELLKARFVAKSDRH
jgi:Arc/MetJ-type ribon-helix-helix transcriptional regulator